MFTRKLGRTLAARSMNSRTASDVVNEAGSCNAYSSGNEVHFYRANAQCENTGRLADVVFHEFGHSVHSNSVIEGMGAILRICKEHNVPCGRPRVDAKNAQQAVDAGYRFLMAGPVRSFAALDACRKVTGRE